MYVVCMLCICCVSVYYVCMSPCVSACIDLDLQRESSNNGSSFPLLVTEVGAPDVHRSPNGSVSCSNRSRCSRTTAVV